MDQLAEEDVLTHYEPEDLEMLASDMDAEGKGFIPLEEFIGKSKINGAKGDWRFRMRLISFLF